MDFGFIEAASLLVVGLLPPAFYLWARYSDWR